MLTAGSARGVAEGLDDLLARAGQDEFARSVIMAGGGLQPEHVPWLARAGVRAFQVGAAVRPLGSAKAYVDADLVRTWRTLIDEALRHGPAVRAEPVEASRAMTVCIDPPTWPGHGRLWSHLVSDRSYAELHEFAARLGIPPRAFERDHYDVIAERYRGGAGRRGGAGGLPGDRPPAARGRSASPQALPARRPLARRGRWTATKGP